MGFQVGQKCLSAKIPEYIFDINDEEIYKAIIRGIFDTDGSFWCERSRTKTSSEWKKTHNYHPEFRITSCSKFLLDQIKFILDNFKIESKVVQKAKKGFRFNRNINNSYALNIRKKAEIEKWFKIIGTNNLRHKTRYLLWKKLGYLPLNTSIMERIKILKIQPHQ
jgi:hypothetical protein